MSGGAAPKKVATGTALLTLLLIACGGGVLAAAGLYARDGRAFLERFDHSVGEMLMLRGRYAEAAGDTPRAMGYYRLALDTRFEGFQNRDFTRYRLGALLLEGGDAAWAIEYLGAAEMLEHDRAQSHATYCRALLALEDAEALAAALSPDYAGRLDPAEAFWFRGKLALLRGDTEAASQAFAEGSRLDPASPCAVELAKLDPERRTALLESFLLQGGSGDAAREARVMLLETRE